MLTSLLEVFEEEMAALILGHAENGNSSDWRHSLRQLIGDITDYCETNLWVYAGRTALSDNSVFMQMHKQTFALLRSISAAYSTPWAWSMTPKNSTRRKPTR